jgi:hypothetical protein
MRSMTDDENKLHELIGKLLLFLMKHAKNPASTIQPKAAELLADLLNIKSPARTKNAHRQREH